ncbi:MAG: hypothetical protein R3E96_06130 [Planctomycetota bacterium]
MAGELTPKPSTRTRSTRLPITTLSFDRSMVTLPPELCRMVDPPPWNNVMFMLPELSAISLPTPPDCTEVL